MSETREQQDNKSPAHARKKVYNFMPGVVICFTIIK